MSQPYTSDVTHAPWQSVAGQIHSDGALSDARKIEYIRAVLDPEHNAMAPPSIVGVATIIKDVSVYACIAVPTVTPNAPMAILWFPQNGVMDLHRYYYCTPTDNPIFLNIVGVTAALSSPMMIPVVISEDIALYPQLDENFTMGRVVSGFVNVQSDATSTTSAALSGMLSVGSLTDTRNPTGSNPDFSPPSIQQQSTVKKDGIIAVKCQDGVTTILGSDIMTVFRPIDRQLTYSTANSGFLAQALNGPIASVDLAVTTTAGAATVYNYGGLMWCSPYVNIAVQNNATQIYLPPTTVSIGQIGLSDVPTFKLGMSVVGANPSSSTNVLQPKGTVAYPPGAVNVVHYFGSVSNGTLIVGQQAILDGTGVTTNIVPQTYPVVYSEALSGFGAAGGQTPNQLFTYTPVTLLNEITITVARPANTVWLGTMFQFASSPTYLGGISGTGTSGATSAQTTFVVSQMEIIANRIYEQGVLGTCRVIRIDALAPGQNLKVKGTIRVEAVSGNNIAPYIQPANCLAAIDQDLLPFLQLLFNSPSLLEFKRCWTGLQYDEMRTHFLPALTAEQIKSILANGSKDNHTRAAGTMAAGLFACCNPGYGIAQFGSQGKMGNNGGMWADGTGMWADGTGMWSDGGCTGMFSQGNVHGSTGMFAQGNVHKLLANDQQFPRGDPSSAYLERHGQTVSTAQQWQAPNNAQQNWASGQLLAAGPASKNVTQMSRITGGAAVQSTLGKTGPSILAITAAPATSSQVITLRQYLSILFTAINTVALNGEFSHSGNDPYIVAAYTNGHNIMNALADTPFNIFNIFSNATPNPFNPAEWTASGISSPAQIKDATTNCFLTISPAIVEKLQQKPFSVNFDRSKGYPVIGNAFFKFICELMKLYKQYPDPSTWQNPAVAGQKQSIGDLMGWAASPANAQILAMKSFPFQLGVNKGATFRLDDGSIRTVQATVPPEPSNITPYGVFVSQTRQFFQRKKSYTESQAELQVQFLNTFHPDEVQEFFANRNTARAHDATLYDKDRPNAGSTLADLNKSGLQLASGRYDWRRGSRRHY